jgi:Flp pilus assembly pilin Flp
MNQLASVYLKFREGARTLTRGQTMTEYALIMAAVAIVVFVTYQSMGNDIGSLVNGINTDLTTAS